MYPRKRFLEFRYLRQDSVHHLFAFHVKSRRGHRGHSRATTTSGSAEERVRQRPFDVEHLHLRRKGDLTLKNWRKLNFLHLFRAAALGAVSRRATQRPVAKLSQFAAGDLEAFLVRRNVEIHFKEHHLLRFLHKFCSFSVTRGTDEEWNADYPNQTFCQHRLGKELCAIECFCLALRGRIQYVKSAKSTLRMVTTVCARPVDVRSRCHS